MKIINILSPIFLGIALAFLVTTCSKLGKETKRANSFEKMYKECLDAEIIYDTIWRDSIITEKIPSPYPVRDTIFLDTVLSTTVGLKYADTLHFEPIDLFYEITTMGYLEELSLGYDLKVPKVITKTKIITHEKEVLFCKPKLYIWGTLRTDFDNIAPGVQLEYKKMMVGYEYDFTVHSLRVGYRFN